MTLAPFARLRSFAPVLLAFGLAACATAQVPTGTPAPPTRAADAPSTLLAQTSTPVPAAEDRTAAETAVAALIATDGVHVVHFWAPWCPNSTGELARGWYELVERHPEVDFTFVTVWNDGEAGQETLDRYAIPDRVTVLTNPDFGPSSDKAQRRKQFLGLPVTWIPTTWVFHKNGELAYAFNYGEMEMDQLDAALAGVARDW